MRLTIAVCLMKLIIILGSGESGMGAAKLAKKHDLPVFVSDMGPISAAAKQELIELEIDFEENGHQIIYDVIPTHNRHYSD